MTSETIDAAERKRRIGIVVDECKGIQPPYIAFYFEAIFYAAERSRLAFGQFSMLAKDRATASDIVASVHEALGHAAAVSKFFFPVDQGRLTRARAGRLKQLFAVGNSSALQDRELRNALEHFDEHLDEFLLADIAGHLFPSPMVGHAEMADDALGYIFRMVDPATESFVLLGRKYSFSAMRKEIERIAELADLHLQT